MDMCTIMMRSVEDLVQRRIWFALNDLARLEPSDDSRRAIQAVFAGPK
jgi:hypothetical protein